MRTGSDVDGLCCTVTCKSIVLLLLIVLPVRALASVDGAPEPAPETDRPPKFLFQMVAGGATFEAESGDHDGVLTLLRVSNETIAFSDRPARIAGAVPTNEFLLSFSPIFWFTGPDRDSFYVDPPNAAFSCVGSSGDVLRAVFVIRAPSETLGLDAVSFEADVLYANDVGAMQACEGPTVRHVILFFGIAL